MKRTVNILEPFVMAVLLLGVFMLIYVLHFLFVEMSGEVMDFLYIWIYMMGAALVFSMFSTIGFLYAKNASRYYYKTIMAFASLILAGGFLATWISGRSIGDLDTYRKVYVFVIITFLALISIASMIKHLESWSRKNDDNFLKNNKDDLD